MLGSILVIFSSTLIGVYFGNFSKYRAYDLKQIRDSLIILRAEIEYTLTPLSQAIENASYKVEAPAKNIFSDMCILLEQKVPPLEALSHSLNNNRKNMYISKDDINQLITLGNTLGYLDKTLQLNTIDLTVKYLQEKIDEQGTLHIKNKKLYQTLGLLAGILVVVLTF